MRFTKTAISGVTLVDRDAVADHRGFFARSFCAEEFSAAGLPANFPQCNVSFNLARGTLRGMHWQADPFAEGKLVRCTRGAIHDVVVDLRPHSPTYRHWLSVELTAECGRAIYIPPGLAHGFQTLLDSSEVFYMMTQAYVHGLARGARWNDPAFGIDWPIEQPILSDRDATYPDYES